MNLTNYLPQDFVAYLKRHKRKIFNGLFILNLLSLWTGYPEKYFYTPPADWSHKGIASPLGGTLQFHNFLTAWDIRVDNYSEEMIHEGKYLKQRLKLYESTLDLLKLQLENYGYTLDKSLIEIIIPATVKTATDLMAEKSAFLKTVTDRRIGFRNDIAYYQSQQKQLVEILVDLLKRGIAMTRSSEMDPMSSELFQVETVEELHYYFLELDQLDNEKALSKLEQSHLPDWTPVICSLLLMGPRQGMQYLGNELRFHNLKYVKIPAVLKTNSESLKQYGAWTDAKPADIAGKISRFEVLAIETLADIRSITERLETKTDDVNALVMNVNDFQQLQVTEFPLEMPNAHGGSFASHKLFLEMNLLKKPAKRVMPDLDLSNSIRFKKRPSVSLPFYTVVTYL